MVAADWQPSTEAELAMNVAVDGRDETAFLTALAASPLLLPVSPAAAAGLEPMRWATGVYDGQTHVIAFTSAAAIAACMPGEEVRYRTTMVADLVTTWPDETWWLAVDPGLPIGTRLPAGLLRELPAPASTIAAGEVEMYDAVQAGDSEAYMAALLRSELFVPLRPGGAVTRDLTDPEFPWWHLPDEAGERTVAVFTSEDRLHDILGDSDMVIVSSVQLAESWPDPSWSLSVNPGTELAAVLPGDAFRRLGEWLVDLRTEMTDELRSEQQRIAAEDVAHDPAPSYQAVRDDAGEDDEGPDPDVPLMLQLVIPHPYLSAYLRDGYDRAAGLVHAWRGPGRDSPVRLYRRLDLLGDGSPFDAADESVAVIRWSPESAAQAEWGQGEPQMESIVVPDGAGIYRLHRDRSEELVARYDSTARHWRLVE